MTGMLEILGILVKKFSSRQLARIKGNQISDTPGVSRRILQKELKNRRTRQSTKPIRNIKPALEDKGSKESSILFILGCTEYGLGRTPVLEPDEGKAT